MTLKRLAMLIGAVRSGHRHWVYYSDETISWWLVSTDDLRSLCNYVDRRTNDHDPYSLWCAATRAVEMPKGWEPLRLSGNADGT